MAGSLRQLAERRWRGVALGNVGDTHRAPDSRPTGDAPDQNNEEQNGPSDDHLEMIPPRTATGPAFEATRRQRADRGGTVSAHRHAAAQWGNQMAFNIAEVFETVAAAVPDKTAVVVRASHGDERKLTFAELDARTNQLAHAMIDSGVGVGDHVGCHLYDGNQYVEAMLAAYKARAVPVNVNFRYVDEELDYLVDNADLKLIVTEPDIAQRAREAAGTVSWSCPVVVADEEYEQVLASQPDSPPDVGQRSADDRYAVWTGGTTGMPKGVMWRQHDIYLGALGGSGNAALGVTPVETIGDVRDKAMADSPLPNTLTLCPMMHAGAHWLALGAILGGQTNIQIRDVHFDPAFALRVMDEERASLVMTIGDAHARPLVDELARSNEAYDLSSLVVYGSGGAILSPAIKDRLSEAIPDTIVFDGFGASETGAQGALAGTGEDGAPRFAMDDHNVVIADDGSLCSPGDGKVGRLAKRGHIPIEYYKDPAKTTETFPTIDGVRYAVPGDLARVEADGMITVFGRGSVSINSGGEKIFPEEVEKILKAHSAVFDATVVGTPNDRFGSQVTAVVELRPESRDDPPTLEVLAAHCHEHLAGYKAPRAVVFVDKTVRSPSGKPDYRWAKETALAELQS